MSLNTSQLSEELLGKGDYDDHEEVRHFEELRYVVKRCHQCEIIVSVLVVINFVNATFLYEHSWRNMNDGKLEDTDKFILVLCSVASIGVTMYKYGLKVRLRQHFLKRIASVQTGPLFRSGEDDFSENASLTTARPVDSQDRNPGIALILLEIFILLLVPWPKVEAEVIIPISKGGTTETHYTSSELLYICMMATFYFPLKCIVIHFGGDHSLEDEYAEVACYSKRVNLDSLKMKKFVQRHLILFSIAGYILSLAFFGQMLRVLERRNATLEMDPMREGPDMGLAAFPEAMWCVFITMTTVGYGDHSPETWLGRISVFFLVIWGIILIDGIIIIGVNNYFFQETWAEQEVLNDLKRSQNQNTEKLENVMSEFLHEMKDLKRLIKLSLVNSHPHSHHYHHNHHHAHHGHSLHHYNGSKKITLKHADTLSGPTSSTIVEEDD